MSGADALAQAQALPSAALVDWIVERYHEAHRAQLPALLAQARAVDARCTRAPLEGVLQALAEVIDQHMFKEEARLFPMMVQGGNTLIGQLIDAMQAEHRAHDAALAAARNALTQMAAAVTAADKPALDALRAAFETFAGQLAEHARIEDEVLFPRFVRAPRAA